eukprot:CAMPEP_0172325512 /NCGR_PEP_ID=MMETSP1058-20130122/54245_1 /TAXON_ID=83371 /ORGANISM="Detonula confervacea, Strain CCMP 353" /LENGTH=303 /DNA_ID=CAMNT_0013042085 /DNA_START=132 /DNA_END=1043 /DNA_ORIENTATION=+
MSGGRQMARTVPATKKGPIARLIGTVDIDGNGTNHPLEQVDPFMLLDQATITKNEMPPFGSHPHRGHSVVTVLLQGQIKSWDSVTQKEATVQGPASYFVDAASGLFHDETSVISDESDADQHPVLFQLWMSVKEEDRVKPPALQYDTNLPLGDVNNDIGEVIGSIRYFVGGENVSIKTAHPIMVGLVTQQPGTTAKIPIDSSFGGFVVHIEGCATYGDNSDSTSTENDVVVFAHTTDETENFLQATTDSNLSGTCRYLICTGQRIEEPWFKKLVANGAIIAKDADEVRKIAAQVEKDKTFVPK